MIRCVWRIILPIISAILGILAANTFNLFAFLPFVPKDFAYEICITAYFSIADILIGEVVEWILLKIKTRHFSNLKVIIAQPGIEVNLHTDTVLNFNSDDLAQANISVSIKGKKKHFKETYLVIKKPAFAEIQSDYNRSEVQIDGENYKINLEKLFGNSDYIETCQTFKVAMIQDPIDGDSSVSFTPELSKHKFNIIYEHNNAQLRAVTR